MRESVDARSVRAHKTQTRPFRLRSRASLIAATVLLQAAVIGLGWFATLHLARADVSERASDRFMEEVMRAVAQFNEQLSKTVDGPVRYETPEWENVQSLVENTKMPRGATLLLLDRFGRVLSHPQLRASPNLRSVDYSEVIINLQPGGELAALGGLKPGSVLVGVTDLLSGSTNVALTYNDKAQVRVLAHQSASELAAIGSRITSGFTLWGALAGLSVLGVSLVGSVLLVRRYDSLLARANERLESEVERRTRTGLAIRNGLIFGLAKLADYRDTDTGSHLERICRYSELVAEELLGKHAEVDQAWIDRLKLASSMHDIGKVGIPDSILLKPGPLTAHERRLMELHPVIGADTLVAIRKRVGDDDLLNMGIQVTLSHHEHFDGTGYPYRLQGEQIPLAARIVALADIYDALTSPRVYKKAMSHEDAVTIIRNSRGTHLDPGVVDAFLSAQDKFAEARLTFGIARDADVRPHLLSTVERAADETHRKLVA